MHSMNIGPYKEVYFDACFVELTVEIRGQVVILKIIYLFNSATKYNLSIWPQITLCPRISFIQCIGANMFSFHEQSILSCLASVSLRSTIDMFSLLLVTPQNLANCREAQYIGSPCFILCFKLRSNTFSPFCIRHY